MPDTGTVRIWLDLVVFFAPWILLPAVGLGFAPRGFRLMILVLSLLFGLGIGAAMQLGGPDSPGLFLPFFGFAVAVGTLLAELTALCIQNVKRRYRALARSDVKDA